MANELFRSQLASYASVHRDWRNKATHFVGIPVIVFSLLLILSLWRFEVGDRAMDDVARHHHRGGAGLDGARSRHRHRRWP